MSTAALPALTTSPNVDDEPAEWAWQVLANDRGTNLEAHPGQVAFLRCRAKIKVAVCGRRWGKSLGEAVDLLWFAYRHKGTEQFLIAPTSDQTTIIFNYCERLLASTPTAQLLVKDLIHRPFPMIEFRNGSFIHARSSGDAGENVRGHGADRVIFEEAPLVSDGARTAIMPLLANSEYAEQVYIGTPFGKDYFWELFTRGQGNDPSCRSFHFPSSSSPYVSPEFLEQQRQDMTAMSYAVEYGAEFREDQNQVFRYSDIQAAIDDSITPEPQEGHRYVIGYDPAKYHDRSAIVVLDSSDHRAVKCCDISGRDYLVQLGELSRLAATYNGAHILFDSTHNDPLLELLKAERLKAEGFNFTNETKQELINGLAIVFEQGKIRIPRHPDLIRELTYYRYELTKAGNVKLGAPDRPGFYDDYVTALALAVQAAGKARHDFMRFAGPDKDEQEMQRILDRVRRGEYVA